MSALTPVMALPIIAVAALLGRSIPALIWIAALLCAKGVQLLLCRHALRGDQLRGPSRSSRWLCMIVAAQTVLTTIWALGLYLVWGGAGQMVVAVGAILATAFAVDVMIVMRSLKPIGQATTRTAAPAPSNPEEALPVRQLALETIRAVADVAAQRGTRIIINTDLDLPHIVGDRAGLLRLCEILTANILEHVPDQSLVNLHGTLNEAGGIRLVVTYDGQAVPNRRLFPVLEGLLRRYGATLTGRAMAANGTSLAILDFPASRSIDTTPVERRPLTRPTSGQRLLMTLTQ